jgi:hypothetical protein
MLYNLSQQRKFTRNFPYSYPFYRIYHYPIHWLLLDQKSPYGGNMLELGFVTNKKTEDFHSELPSRVAVLLVIRDCLHNQGS